MASFCFEALIKCISWCLIPQRIQAKVPFEWKTLKAVTICGQKGISVLFTVRAFSSLTAMLIAPSQCGPDEMVVGFRAALRWACAPNGWIRGSLGQAEAWHDTTLLWGWFEVSARKEKGAKQALICPSPAPGPGGWDCEMLRLWVRPRRPPAAERASWDREWWSRGLGRRLPRAKLRCGSHQICLDEYWRGHLRTLCGKSAADNRLLTRRGNILTSLCNSSKHQSGTDS